MTIPTIIKKVLLFFFSQSWLSPQIELFSWFIGPFRRALCRVWQTRVLCLNKQIFAMMSIAFSYSSGKIASWQNFYAVLKLTLGFRSESWKLIILLEDIVKKTVVTLASRGVYVAEFSSGMKNNFDCVKCVFAKLL